jgi:hypothetical protein
MTKFAGPSTTLRAQTAGAQTVCGYIYNFDVMMRAPRQRGARASTDECVPTAAQQIFWPIKLKDGNCCPYPRGT